MPLTNEQYNRVMHVYDSRRLERQHELDRRKHELLQALPELGQLEDDIRMTAIRAVGSDLKTAALRRASGETDAESTGVSGSSAGQAAREIEALLARKQELMAAAGFAADYLEVPYVCGDCMDTGYVNGSRCHCFTQLSLELLYDSHTVSFTGRSLEQFSLQYYPEDLVDPLSGFSSRELAQTAARCSGSFVENFDTSFENILLTGQTGTGKTHLSECIGGELLAAGHTVVYLTAFELFAIMKKEAFSRDDTQSVDYSNLFSCDLLIIDDLGTELVNSMTNSQLFELLNERIRRKASTLISTNLDLVKLRDVYTERLVSRFLEYYRTLTLIGPDIRMIKKAFIPAKQ